MRPLSQKCFLLVPWLCLLVALPACQEPAEVERGLADRLVSDGVITTAGDVKLLDATDHWKENTYLVEFPAKSLNAKLRENRGSWPLYSQNLDEDKEYQGFLKKVVPFSTLKPETGGKKKVYFGFGKGCWYYVLAGDGEKAFVVVDNY